MAFLEEKLEQFFKQPNLKAILPLWLIVICGGAMAITMLLAQNTQLRADIKDAEEKIRDYHLYHVQIKAIEDDLKSTGASHERETPLTQLEKITQKSGIFRKMDNIQPTKVTLEDGQQFQAFRLSFTGVALRDFTSFMHAITFKSVLKPYKIELNKIGTDYLNAQITLMGEAE